MGPVVLVLPECLSSVSQDQGHKKGDLEGSLGNMPSKPLNLQTWTPVGQSERDSPRSWGSGKRQGESPGPLTTSPERCDVTTPSSSRPRQDAGHA